MGHPKKNILILQTKDLAKADPENKGVSPHLKIEMWGTQICAQKKRKAQPVAAPVEFPS
jgi:hypothetical protein